MESQQGQSLEVVFVVPASPEDGKKEAARVVERWLEEAWRHGEVVADNDGLPTDETPPPNRFTRIRSSLILND